MHFVRVNGKSVVLFHIVFQQFHVADTESQIITHTVFDFDEDTQYDIHYLVLWIIITHTVFGSTESQMMTHAAFGSTESQMMTHAAFGSTESPNKAKQLPSRVIAREGTQHQTRNTTTNKG